MVVPEVEGLVVRPRFGEFSLRGLELGSSLMNEEVVGFVLTVLGSQLERKHSEESSALLIRVSQLVRRSKRYFDCLIHGFADVVEKVETQTVIKRV